MRVSIFIPTKNPGASIVAMVESLIDQSYAPDEILVIDSSSTDGSIDLLRKKHKTLLNNVLRIHKISPEEFGHGKTRNLATKMLTGEVIIFLTQDVTIDNASFVQNIIEPLRKDMKNELVATFARQIPRAEHHPLEKFFYSFYFPEYDILHAKIPGRDLVMADIFFSNAAACIRRSILKKFPFDEGLVMCEDQKFSLDTLHAGYKILYNSKATVVHSHNYTFTQTVARYFDTALAFMCIVTKPRSNMFTVGTRFIYRELLFVLGHNPLWLWRYLSINSAKIIGTLLALISHLFPTCLKKRLSMHKNFWND